MSDQISDFDNVQTRPQPRKLSRTNPQEVILDTAAHLFYAHGIHTVGMDELIQETSLSKMSVYHLFPGKAESVVAYLRCTSAQVLEMAVCTPVPPFSALTGRLLTGVAWLSRSLTHIS